MEVGVKVWVEDLITGAEKHVSSAFLTFVSIDATGAGVLVPPIVPQTDEEKRRYEQAGERREYRLALRRR
jgi:acyl-CoA hydrolase